MTSLKGWITTTFLAATLTLSTIPANGGVIIGGIAQEPCAQTDTKDSKSDVGVIIGGLTGVIIAGFTGVIIGGLSGGVIIGGIAPQTPIQNCGVIIAG